MSFFSQTSFTIQKVSVPYLSQIYSWRVVAVDPSGSVEISETVQYKTSNGKFFKPWVHG